MRPAIRRTRCSALAALLVLAACGGSQSSPAPAATYAIAGRVSGAAGSGVAVSLSGDASAQTTTDANGNYAFSGLRNGLYFVTPARAGVLHEPSSHAVVVAGASRTGFDFRAYPLVYAISGAVTAASPAGFTVTASGPSTASAVTDVDGHYVVTVATRGNYVVAASRPGYVFSPPSRTVTLTFVDAPGQDFAAASGVPHAISGTVTGAVAADVRIVLSGDAGAATYTDPSGAFTFSGLADGHYVLTPSMADVEFAPSTIGLTLAGTDATGHHFTSSRVTVVSGQVTGFGTAGISIALAPPGLAAPCVDPSGAGTGGGSPGTTDVLTANVDAAGVYTVSRVPDGAYRITPCLAGALFSPPYLDVTVAGRVSSTGNDFVVRDLEWATWTLPPLTPVAGDYTVDAASGTVTDHATGLVWQRASEGDPLVDCLGGPAAGCYAWVDAVAHCAGLSLAGVGAGGWRLPTLIELESVADYGAYGPAILAAAFPSTPPEYHWSATPVAGTPSSAWSVTFRNGESVMGDKSQLARARCVRSGPLAAPPGPLAHYDLTTVTATDRFTGLVWQRGAAPDQHSWTNASAYCAGLSLGGFATGWRLPTLRELVSLTNVRTFGPAFDLEAFPSSPVDRYWSATETADPSYPGYHWAVHFDMGDSLIGPTWALASVRCVR